MVNLVCENSCINVNKGYLGGNIMTYFEWAKEYEMQTNTLKMRIDKLKKKRENCRKAYMILDYNKRINSLYIMYLESKHVYLELLARAKEGLKL